MMKTMSRVMLAAAAAGLAFAPIAAQANTRAGDSAPVFTGNAVSQPGIGRSAEGEEIVKPGFLAAILALLIAAGVVIIIDDGDGQSPGDQSPGT